MFGKEKRLTKLPVKFLNIYREHMKGWCINLNELEDKKCTALSSHEIGI